MRHARSIAALVVVLASCGDTSEDPKPTLASLKLQPPSDASCIGVSGFLIDVSVNGAAPRSVLSLRSAPVLDRDDCRVEPPATFSDLSTDVPITVTVRGYDGAKQLRVSGSVLLTSLHDSSSVTLVLAPTGVSSSPVLTIDRTMDVFAGSSPSGIASIELSVPGQIRFDLPVSEDIKPFFGVGEPWAVAFPGALAAGDEVSARATLVGGGVLNTKLVVAVSDNGDYFVASSSPPHP